MGFGAIFLLAVGLSMDAAAVAAARGLAAPRVGLREVARIALYFGGFQAAMPLLGWLLGREVGPLLAAWDHWVAFALLAGLGAKMLWDARSEDDDAAEVAATERALEWSAGPEAAAENLFRHRTLVALAVATSIDAFAAGLTLPLLRAPVALTVITIGVVTASLSAAALLLGKRLGAALGSKLDVLGGVILIALGARVLAEHLLAGK